MMNKFFTITVICGTLMCVRNGHASTLSCWDMSPQEVREKINQRIMSIEATVPTVFSVIDHHISNGDRNTSIRIYTPSEGNKFPVILFIHGGAWVAGNLETHDNLSRYLSSETQAIVVSVGYLNAPEGKFPLPLEQCYDTLIWITEHGPEFSIDTTKIAVVGDSAGGNMAAALCLMARDRSGPNIDLQVLINPAPDLTCNGTILRQNDALDTLRWYATQYLSDPSDINNPYVSPMVASNLSNLPPAVVILAEHDDLHEAGQKYADQLRRAGVPTHVYCQQGVNHLAGHGAKASSYARESLGIAVEELRKTFLVRSVKQSQKSFQKERCEFIFRPQTPQEEFSYVEDLYSRLSWFKENGYDVVLPVNLPFELLHQNPKILSDTDKAKLKQIFFTEIYDTSSYDLSLESLKESEPLIRHGLEKLSLLKANWNFKILEKYEILLTLYGPGGNYNSQKGIVLLFATPNGEFKRSTGYEVLLHEIVHIGIEETIVKQYKLSHWEKERLVDLICYHYLNEILPTYKMQLVEDKRIDAFVDQYAIIHDLPLAIAKFVEKYPR